MEKMAKVTTIATMATIVAVVIPVVKTDFEITLAPLIVASIGDQCQPIMTSNMMPQTSMMPIVPSVFVGAFQNPIATESENHRCHYNSDNGETPPGFAN